MFYKSSEIAALLRCRRLHFLETRSSHENSRSRTVMPIPLPRPVNRPSEPDPESMILCRNPAPRSFDAPDSLAAPAPLTEQPPKPRPVPAPIPRGPVPSPLGMIVSSLHFGRFFSIPWSSQPRTEDILDPCRELRVYAVPCARTAGIRSRLPVLPRGVHPYGPVFGLPDLAPFRCPLPFPWVLFRLLLAFDHLPISSPTNRNILNLLMDDHFRDSTPRLKPMSLGSRRLHFLQAPLLPCGQRIADRQDVAFRTGKPEWKPLPRPGRHWARHCRSG